MDIKLTSQQAYRAMYLFLCNYSDRFNIDPPVEISILLSSMQLLNDGEPADPAFKEDWQLCVEEVLREETKK